MDLRGCAAPDETLENPYGGARRWNGVAGRARRCLYRQSSVLHELMMQTTGEVRVAHKLQRFHIEV